MRPLVVNLIAALWLVGCATLSEPPVRVDEPFPKTAKTKTEPEDLTRWCDAACQRLKATELERLMNLGR